MPNGGPSEKQLRMRAATLEREAETREREDKLIKQVHEQAGMPKSREMGEGARQQAMRAIFWPPPFALRRKNSPPPPCVRRGRTLGLLRNAGCAPRRFGNFHAV